MCVHTVLFVKLPNICWDLMGAWLLVCKTFGCHSWLLHTRIKGRVSVQPQWNFLSNLQPTANAVSKNHMGCCSSSAGCNFSESQHRSFLHFTTYPKCEVLHWGDAVGFVIDTMGYRTLWAWLWTKWYLKSFSVAMQFVQVHLFVIFF